MHCFILKYFLAHDEGGYKQSNIREARRTPCLGNTILFCSFRFVLVWALDRIFEVTQHLYNGPQLHFILYIKENQRKPGLCVCYKLMCIVFSIDPKIRGRGVGPPLVPSCHITHQLSISAMRVAYGIFDRQVSGPRPPLAPV